MYIMVVLIFLTVLITNFQQITFVNKATRPNAVKFFRTQSPRHFEGGDWNEGGSCKRDQPLSLKEVLRLKCIKLFLLHAFCFSFVFQQIIHIVMDMCTLLKYLPLLCQDWLQYSCNMDGVEMIV
jgi:hypothetical protein